MKTSEKLALQGLAWGTVVTIGLIWFMEEYIKFSLPWWGYAIWWVIAVGSAGQTLQRDKVVEKLLDEEDDEKKSNKSGD